MSSTTPPTPLRVGHHQRHSSQCKTSISHPQFLHSSQLRSTFINLKPLWVKRTCKTQNPRLPLRATFRYHESRIAKCKCRCAFIMNQNLQGKPVTKPPKTPLNSATMISASLIIFVHLKSITNQ